MLSPEPGPEDDREERSGLRQSAHWAALVTCVAGCLALCYSDYAADQGAAQLAYPPLVAAGLFWLAEFALAALSGAWGRGLVAVPVIALAALALVLAHVPFWIAWQKSRDAFDNAAAELRRHPENAPAFHRSLGAWEIDAAQMEPGSGALYFEAAGDEPNRPVFANAPDAQVADWGSYRDCEKIKDDWYRCVWRFSAE